MKTKQEKLEKALRTIVEICPCYGKRNKDPFSIKIGNGLVLCNKRGHPITSGYNSVAEEMIKRYSIYQL